MKKQELKELALEVTELMAKRKESVLTSIAQTSLNEGTSLEYLKMMFEQANQASKRVNTILGDELFNKVKNLKDFDFKE